LLNKLKREGKKNENQDKTPKRRGFPWTSSLRGGGAG